MSSVSLSARTHLAIFLIAFAVVVLRRPDAIFHAQFYAEDGAVFYAGAYQYGLHSLLMPYGGYLHTLLRLVALFTLLFPFAWAPLVMTLVGLTFQVMPVNILLSSRFSNVDFPTRLLGSFIYLAVPNAFEIHANIANVQWHMALVTCLLVLGQPATGKAWQVFDAIMLVLTSLSTPMVLLLVPLAAFVWRKRRNTASVRSFAFLVPGAMIEMLAIAIYWHSRTFTHISADGQAVSIGGPNGATPGRFFSIVGRQLFLYSLLGLKTQGRLLNLKSIHWIEIIATALGLAVLLYALRYAHFELKAFILFALGVLTLGLLHPVAGTPDRAQWDWMTVPGCGNRYYFFSTLAFVASLVWIAGRKASPGMLRTSAVVLLLMLPIGICRDWHYTRFPNYHFRQYVRQFEQAPPGTEMRIPIYPDWSMTLTKH